MPIFLNASGRRVLYIHVPKTGGTYVEDLFVANGYARFLWEGRPRRLGYRLSPQHYHREIYDELVDLAAFDLSFMTVRHPVDRLLSEYRNQRAADPELTLERWLDRITAEMEKDPSSYDNHLRPQAHFHHDRLKVYRQEDGFGTDWARQISSEFDLSFKKLRTTTRRHTFSSQDPLSSTDRRQVLTFCDEVYRVDFDLFGYDPESASALRRDPDEIAEALQTHHSAGTRRERLARAVRRPRLTRSLLRARRRALAAVRRGRPRGGY